MEKNSIHTLYRREMLTQVTSGAKSAPIPPITQFALGSGGTDGTGEPIPPSTTATSLNNEVKRYPIDGPPTYPVSTTARYSVTIPADDLVGIVINEAALVDSAGQICAIQVMYNKRKDGGTTITITLDEEF